MQNHANLWRLLACTALVSAASLPDLAFAQSAAPENECVGVPSLAVQALESTNPTWGLALNVGIMPSGAMLNVQPMSLQGGRRWGGTAMGGAKRLDVSRYVDMFVAGEIKLDDLVSHRLTLDEINHGFEMMRTGEAVRSVVLFD